MSTIKVDKIQTRTGADNLIVELSSGQRVARFDSGDNTSAFISFKAPNTSLPPAIGVKDEDLFFSTGDAVERARFDADSNGDLILQTGNMKPSSQKGVDFTNFTSSDTAGTHQGTPTITGHVLMDYEEGTWPGEFRGKSGSGTSTTAAGHYTKIGRMVYIAITFNVLGGSGFSAEPQIRGLPFRAHGTHNFAVHIGHNKLTRLDANAADSATGQYNGDYIASVTAGQSFIYISGHDTAVSNWSDIQAGSYHFSGWYMTND